MSIDAIRKTIEAEKDPDFEFRGSSHYALAEILSAYDALKEENKRLKPYETELLRLAAVVGEENDPFAAWESIEPVLMQADLAKTRVEMAEEKVERLKEERDALFTASKCECGADEACRNLASLKAENERLKLLVDGQDEQLEIQGNELIRRNSVSVEQRGRAEAAEAEVKRLRDALDNFQQQLKNGLLLQMSRN